MIVLIILLVITVIMISLMIVVSALKRRIKELEYGLQAVNGLINSINNTIVDLTQKLRALEYPPKYKIGDRVQFEYGTSWRAGIITNVKAAQTQTTHYTNSFSIIYYNGYDIFSEEASKVYENIDESYIKQKY